MNVIVLCSNHSPIWYVFSLTTLSRSSAFPVLSNNTLTQIIHIYIYIYKFIYSIVIHHTYLLYTSFDRTIFKTNFLNSYILCPSIFCYSTMNFNQKLYWFLNVEWFRHLIIVFVFLFSSPWRWPHEWPKHVGAFVRRFIKFYACDYCMEHGACVIYYIQVLVSSPLSGFLLPETKKLSVHYDYLH